MTRIAVFGTGYLGTTHAACMAELGHEVLGVDIDVDKLARLGAGEAPFYEPGLDEVLSRNVDGADVTLVLTDWSEFRELVPGDLDGVVRQRRIIDGRNCVDPKAWRGAGWLYRGVGRK